MIKLARVERSGDEETVHLPSGFTLGADEVEVTRFGDVIVLKALRRPSEPWAGMRAAIAMGVTPDFAEAVLDRQDEQERPDLGKLFP